MKEILINADNLTEGYHKALVALNQEGDIVNCSDWNCTQKELSMTIHIEHPLQEPMISRLCVCSPESLEQYRQEMLDGILDFEIGKTWSYSYHNRMVNYPMNNVNNNQIEFVISELKRNPESRRAVIDIRANSQDMYSSDPACLQHVQFFVRNNKLDCDILFRSNDACKATFMNAFALIQLQKSIADKLGVEVGTYTHRANSFHCYENDYETLNNYCKAINNKDINKLTFDYTGNWDNKMVLSRPAIIQKVKDLKG